MAKAASVQKDLEGNFVVRTHRSKRFDRFRQGAYEATLPRNAPEALQKRAEAMRKAEKPEAEGGGPRFTEEEIIAFVDTTAENKVRVAKDSKKADRLADDRSGLVAELVNYLTTGEPPTCPKTELVRRSERFSTDLFYVQLADGAIDAKQTKWSQKLKKAGTRAEKGKKGGKARERLAEVERTIEGEKRQWVQERMRKLPRTTIDAKGQWDLHGDKLREAILEGKNLRKAKSE